MTTTHEGKLYMTVSEAAKSLKTTATKIRALMGSEDLYWTQLRTNGKLWVSAESVADYKRRKNA